MLFTVAYISNYENTVYFVCEQLSKYIENDESSVSHIGEGCYRCGKGTWGWILWYQFEIWAITLNFLSCLSLFLYLCPYIYLYPYMSIARCQYLCVCVYRHRCAHMNIHIPQVCSLKKHWSKSILVVMSGDVRKLSMNAKLVCENLMRNKVFINSQSISTLITC